MLGENLKALRKNRGMTQEELASRLHVVRQTVSKWEKGASVPDADMLQRMAELFEVEVTALLGPAEPEPAPRDGEALARQLAGINEQLAAKNRRARRIWRILGIGLLVILAVQLFMVLLFTAVSGVPATVG